ncbi:beta-galactosidase [Paenibacillus eucommiae]|uniref:Glycoside hydrolase family 42 N-terminal domain-containing protein n=1 Tax=Paenibacillus eucommiae TaxID=1355755 RepID=A0ABS4JB03_9BACL|nr:beta-galactosidase [Paenibacillus eucommiae]MBP1996990.1 hypothetical protein [Paenibacillus eucommiae]
MKKRVNNNPSPAVAGEFPIGIFVEPPPAVATDAAYAEIRAMNANLIVANQSTTPATTDLALDKAAANGLMMLVSDTGLRWIQSEWISQNFDDGEGLYLRSGQSIGQTFTIPDVNELSLAILSFKKNGIWEEGTSVTLSIYDSPAKETPIVSSTLEGPLESNYPEFILNTMPVSADSPHYPVAAGTVYYMELTTDSGADLGPFRTSASDVYAGGQAYVNGDPLPFDLYFQITLKTPNGGTISAFSPTGRSSDDYIERLVAHYKSHPAMFGYNLIDEPFGELYPMMKEASDKIKELDPNRLIYTNHYAMDDSSAHYFALENGRPMDFAEYLNNWLDTNPDMVSFDYYPFKEEGIDEKPYYQTLEFIRTQSLGYGIDFWAYIQSSAYDTFSIIEPNEQQIRFQIYSTLAYGAKGYVYYTYYSTGERGKDQGHSALILRDGSKNATYDYAKQINGEVLKLGPVLLSLTSKEVYHTGHLPPSAQPLPPTFFWQPSGIEADVPMIISSFEDEAGKTFIMVVNKDLEQSQTLTFLLSGGVQSVKEVCKHTGEEVEAAYNPATSTVSADFAPGDGRLFAIGK